LGFHDLATDQLYGRFSRRKRILDILRLLGAVRSQSPNEHLYVIWGQLERSPLEEGDPVGQPQPGRVGLHPDLCVMAQPIECQFGELDTFVIEGSDFTSHLEAAAAIRNYVRDRNRRARLRALQPTKEEPKRAKVA